ncbi:DUF433 domain-containing protein [Nocardia otitidiscaviarum]|uniref:DUF433 domain-containing protein n=2 Tax=Nocardia otitidiscaviarum TaxID=1823 RepID=UPI001893AFAC|nr:DUF433 domain-containing protein [Nocardia otitidiscaviarum]MBF6236177.1 DUF433 domain-containing protein [Nocardia otitidiscaviarum]
MVDMERITSDPDICRGLPTVRGLRYPVALLADLLGAGVGVEEILADSPMLEREDLLAVWRYAAGAENRAATCGSRPGMPPSSVVPPSSAAVSG